MANDFGIFEGEYLWHRDVFNSLKDSVDLDTTVGFVKICAQLCEFLQNNAWPRTESDFLVSRIKYAYESFSVRLLFHSDLELSQIGDVFENRISKFSVLEKDCVTSQGYKDLINYGAFGALSITQVCSWQNCHELDEKDARVFRVKSESTRSPLISALFIRSSSQ